MTINNKCIVTIMILVLIVTVIMNAGCIQEDREKNENTVKITDMLDRTVKVPEKVDKVVGVGAGALRLLVYLECTDKVVGVEDIEKDGGKPYNYAHPELADLPFIGPMYGGDPELILIQEPEVIFWTYATVGDADELEEKTGIPVVVLGYGDLDDNKDVFYESLRLVAKVMGKETRAEELIQYIDDTIGYLNDRTKDIPDSQKQLVYVGGVSYYGNHGILSTEAAYSPFLYVNAKNVASELGMEHADIDKEKLIEWDPEIIFIDENGLYMVEEDLKDEAYTSVKAVTNCEFYGVMPYNWYDANFATVLANAFYVGKVLYPANFTDIDPEDMADEVYLKFLGKGVYQDMKDYYGGFKKLEL